MPPGGAGGEGEETSAGFSPEDLEPLLPGLVRFARSLTRDPVAADDLAQETVARALERRAQFRGDASLATWLHRIAHNLAVDGFRRSAAEAIHLDPDALGADIDARWADERYTVDAETVLLRAERRDDLEDALAHLPAIYRAAVVLHDVEGWTTKEIAAVTDVGLPAAKQRLRRGRMMLVSELARADERRAALQGVPLRCWEARQHVSDYLDGELDPETTSTVEAHLAACPTCPPLYAALVGVHAGLGALRDPDTVISDTMLARLAPLAE